MINKNHYFILSCVFALLIAPLTAFADTMSEAAERGTLRVGVSLFTPWTIKNEDGSLKGFEIDVARKLAEDMGLKAEFREYDWENILTGLEKDEIDVIAAGIAITPKRAMRVNFSVPYDEWGATLVTNVEKTSGIGSLGKLNQPSTIMAIVNETFAFEVSGRLFNNVDMRVFTTSAEAEQAVVSGEAHAYLVSGPEAYFLALENPGVVDLPLGEPLVGSRAAFAVAKGDQDWLNFLNAWVMAREADNWIETAHHYWFRSIAWRATEEEATE